ncbi:tyrosine/serine/threonine protein phosphatase [Rhodotorula sphaerocarpa]
MPFPPPIPSTSAPSSPPRAANQPHQPHAGSFIPPPSPQAQGGGLAARRAAKLGKKRLSLLVPANPHSSVPVPGPVSASLASPDASGQTLLSPLTPSFLPSASLTTSANGSVNPTSASFDAETRSLPPSPLSLTTFIGPEGSEAPDRTIGRLMLKQQADEMREQMRGKRGMKRRTSIPRLNLVKTGVASAQPANLDAMASSASSAAMSPAPSSSSSTSRGATSSGATSAVQFLRAGDAGETGSQSGANGDDTGLVEEFPYALGPREILPGIFLGSEQNAKDAGVLRDWRIGFVLNVAKEVECPWTDEIQLLAAQDAVDRLTLNGSGRSPMDFDQPSPRVRTPLARRATPPPPLRRANTDAPEATPILSTSPDDAMSVFSSEAGTITSSPIPVRPTFIRPTASTPNLHASFDPLASPPPPVPPIPDLRDVSGVYASLGEAIMDPDPPSPSAPEPAVFRRPSRASRSLTRHPTVSTCRAPDAMRIPPNPATGRPELEYLWLKWGHDEADLVEAQKFQTAFDFLDEARERDARVLVHCQCGVSRSATVVIAYCMREAAKAIEEDREANELAGCAGMHDTYSFVKEKSEWVGPNLSLVFQLVAYERILRGDSINGDDDLSEPPSAVLRSDPPRRVADVPAAPPHVLDRSSVLSHHPVPGPLSRTINGALASPRTPISDASLADSQMSTPDLHDPLISPALSFGTKSSSVTSTPLSPERHSSDRPAVRIVTNEGDEESRLRVGHVDAALANEPSTKNAAAEQKSIYVLPMPPRDVPQYAAADVASPTVPNFAPAAPTTNGFVGPAHAPGPPVPTSGRRVMRPAAPTLSLDMSAASRTTSAARPLLSTISASPMSAAVRSPTVASAISPRAVTASLPSAFSPVSSSSYTPSSLSSSSPGKTPLSAQSPPAPSSAESTLSRSHSGRRFGAGQSRSERRASHRRVCSDTIRVPTPLGFTPTSSVVGSPATPPTASNVLPSPVIGAAETIADDRPAVRVERDG